MARAGGLPLPTITDDRALGAAKIQRSLRFNNSDSAYLNRTPSSQGDRRVFTLSWWMKCDGDTTLFSAQRNTLNPSLQIKISDQRLVVVGNKDGSSSSYMMSLVTDAQFRDKSAWYHCVVAFNTSDGTASNRIKIYVNGSQITSFSAGSTGLTADTYPSSGDQTSWGTNEAAQNIGRLYSGSGYYDGYLAEVHYVDGSQLTPDSFGFTDPQTGIWMPKRYEGGYGNVDNGFYLDFSDNSSTSALGIDKSPNGNDLTTNNFSVSAGTGNDSLEDTPTNNFCTLNALDKSNNADLREGGLTLYTDSNDQAATGTFAVASGQWYWEIDMTDAEPEVGIAHDKMPLSNKSTSLPTNGQISFIVAGADGNSNFLRVDGHTQSGTGLSAQSGPGTIGIALDMDNKKIWFSNTSGTYFNSGNPVTGVNPAVDFSSTGPNYPTCAVRPIVCMYQGSAKQVSINCGQRPFTYTPPTGFKTLNSKNLPPITPSIVKPQRHFETLLYTGDGQNNRRVTGLEFKPDLVWVKQRAQSGGGEISGDHGWYDSIRGVTKRLKSNSTDAEGTFAIGSFDDGGFTFATETYYNDNNDTFVAWCWKAGGAAVSNSDGSITSSVSANTTSGFSVVTWTGTNGNGTVGHGLGKAPKWIVIRRRDSGSSWVVYHEEVGNTKRLTLDSIGAESSASANWFNNTSPTSTTFSVGSDGGSNGSTDGYVAWCWADISGFSKFDSYTGNGSSEGVYVHLGFRPAWLMVKKTSNTDSWLIMDNKRDIDNPATQTQAPQSNREDNVNTGGIPTDFLSQGFKCRGSGGDFNADGQTYIYMAFAEQPGATPFDTFPNAR